jgi:short-subunit dehydrogenase
MGKHLKSNSCRRSKEEVSVSAVTPGPIQESMWVVKRREARPTNYLGSARAELCHLVKVLPHL